MPRKDSPAPRKPRPRPSTAARAKLLAFYSAPCVDHILRPRNMGRIRRPDGYARTPAGQGDTVEFFLRLEGDVLAECTFETDGCAATVACASAVTELAAGRSARRALAEVTDKEIIRALGGLPEGNLHCAGPVAETFRQAVADALGHKGQTWRKLYRPL